MNDQRLTVCHQLFCWTSFGHSICSINKMISSQDHPTVWGVPWVPFLQARTPLLNFFSNWIIFEIRHCKKVYFLLCKFSLHFLTTSLSESSSLCPTAQLGFSWILKMFDQQNDRFKSHLTVWVVTSLPCVLAENSFTENVLQMKKIFKLGIQKIFSVL